MRIRTASWLCAATLLVGCGGDGYQSPTAPPAAPATPAPAPSPAPTPAPPPAADVSGSWSGTTTVTWDPIDGGGSCSESAWATFTQSGAEVTGSITDGEECPVSHQLRFEGSLASHELVGAIVFPAYSWHAAGEVNGDRMFLWSMNVTWQLHRSR